MSRILIIGGGFAGISALRGLSKLKGHADIILIDKKEEFNFLPALPDIIGERIRPEFLANRLEDVSRICGCRFINAEVRGIDLGKQMVFTSGGDLNYDHLLISSGSETNFYGNEAVKKYAHKLDDVGDAEKILQGLAGGGFETFMIAGGGYTGVEIAANLRRYLIRHKRRGRIVIIERADSILGPLPEWMKRYVSANLNKLSIEVFLNTVVENINGARVSLSSRGTFDKAMLIWAAGVKTADFLSGSGVDKTPQGRLNVDGYLRAAQRCFAVGDAANFYHRKSPLRMAVQFAVAQGALAAENIIRSEKGLALKRYLPLDPGYIIPMANNRSCGKILGINTSGVVPTVLHYLMCVYRSYGIRNKSGIVSSLIRRR